MKTLILLLIATSVLVWAKDTVDVEVKATHAVTHNDQSVASALRPRGLPTQQVESFNLDTVINGEHVFLTCAEVSKTCEAPALATYKGEMRHGKWIKLTFEMPVTHKEVSRSYKIAGSW
jgi:hypothetical protein